MEQYTSNTHHREHLTFFEVVSSNADVPAWSGAQPRGADLVRGYRQVAVSRMLRDDAASFLRDFSLWSEKPSQINEGCS